MNKQLSHVFLFSVVLLIFIGQLTSSAIAQRVLPRFPGINGPVYSMVKKGDTIYFGGLFSKVYSPDSSSIFGVATNPSNGAVYGNWAKPNNKVMSAIPDGNGGFFITGNFTEVGDSVRERIAHLDSTGRVTSRFSKTGLNIVANSLLLSGDTLYAGGSFTGAGTFTNGNGFAFDTLGNRLNMPEVNGEVRCVISDGSGGFYIGGDFTEVGGVIRKRLARIDSSGNVMEWNPVANNSVYTLAKVGNTIFIGGNFTTINGTARLRGASLDATTGGLLNWSPNADSTISRISVFGIRVYIGGLFNNIGGAPRKKLACLDTSIAISTTWNPGANGQVRAFALYGNTMYVSGPFDTIGGQYHQCMAAIDTASGSVLSWGPAFSQVSATIVNDLLLSGSTLYIAGSFNTINSQSRQSLASFDLTTGNLTGWNPQMTVTDINSIKLYGNRVFVCGQKASYWRRHFAALDTTSGAATEWAPPAGLGDGNDIAFSGNRIYVGGSFTNGGGSLRCGIAAFDANTGTLLNWKPLVSGSVQCMIKHGTNLFLGGDFSKIDNQTRTKIGSVNILTGAVNSWAPDYYPNNIVYSLAIYNSSLLIGGAFNFQFRKCLAAYDLNTALLTNWAPSVNGIEVRKIILSGSTLYVGGEISSIDGKIGQVVTVDASTGAGISSIFGGVGGPAIRTMHLAANNTVLYVSGNFATVSNARGLSTSNGTPTNWNPWPSSELDVIAESGSVIFIGGEFTTTGNGITRNNLAAVYAPTGVVTSWNPNANNRVRTLVIDNDKIYAGGDFTTIGGQTRNRIAAIDRGSGSLLGWNPNANNTVYTLALHNNNLYVGGRFSSIGGQSRSYLAMLNTTTGTASSWNPAPNSWVNAIAPDTATVYVGGNFTTIGGQSRARLAELSLSTGNANGWNPGADAEVYSILRYNGTIYAGGQFSIAGGASRKRIAAFTPGGVVTGWNPPLSSYVLQIIASGPRIYACGAAHVSDWAVTKNGIVSLDSSTGQHTPWKMSITQEVRSAIISDSLIYISGYFGAINNTVRVNTAVITRDETFNAILKPVSLCQGATSFVLVRGGQSRNNGNTYKVWVSDNTGSFSNAQLIGSLSATSADSLVIQIPESLPPGENYQICISTTTPAEISTPSNPFTVRNLPDAAVSLTGNSPFCNGDSVKLSVAIGNTYRWQIDSINTQNSGDTLFRYYAKQTGNYRVRVTGANGCVKYSTDTNIVFAPPPVISSSVNDSNQCFAGNQFSFSGNCSVSSGSLSTIKWYFGDSTSLIGDHGIKTYTTPGVYVAYLFAQSNKGCKDSLSKTIVVYPQTNIAFSVNDSDQCKSGNNFVFANNSNVSSGTFTNLWNLGPIDTTNQNNPTKTFTTEGIFAIKLITTTNFGCKDSLSKYITVYPQTAVGFSVNDSDQCKQGNNFMFSNNSTVSTGTFTNFWSFGNADTSSQKNPSNAYGTSGSYIVKLLTTTDFGCKDSISKSVIVHPDPLSSFNTDSSQCFNGNNFVMTNTSSGSPTAYHWDFGNGSTSSAVTPSTSYSSVGIFPVRLVAINSFGCLDTVVHSVRVKTNPATPVVSYSPDTIVCDNVNIILKTNSTDTKSWLKGSVTLGVNADSIVVNNTQGAYTLKITNNENCDATSGAVNLFFKTTPAKPIVSVAGNVFTSSAATGNQWYNTSGAIAGQTGQTYLASSPGQYYTIVTVNACSSPASDMVNFPATGVASLSPDNGISVYPNPNNGSFTIVLNKKIEELVLVKVLDLTGRIVFEENKSAKDLSIQTNGLANGSYIVEVIANKETQRVRVTISR